MATNAPRTARIGSLLLALAALLASAGLLPGAALGAQELTGVAVGPDGQALSGIPVVLHRVGGSAGGAFVATDTTNAEGGFHFALDQAETAIYFAALRYEGSMYIGPAVEGGGEPVTGYMLRVEPGSEAGAVASALSGGPGSAPVMPPARSSARTAAGGISDAGAFILVGLLALGAVGAFLLAAPRYRVRQTREAVIELATVENGLARAGAEEERARLEKRRARLRERLQPRG